MALKDFSFIILLNIAHNVSNTGNAKTISGATITISVYVLATPSIDIIASENPKKLEPTSPIKVFAGLKLNGRNPTKEPSNAVINKMAISGEPFNVNIINNETLEIIAIPEDNPSNPSIKLIAFVTPTIQQIVKITEKAPFSPTLYKNGILRFPILTPAHTTIEAAIICASNFTNGETLCMSSK